MSTDDSIKANLSIESMDDEFLQCELASDIHENIMLEITEFEKDLDSSHEVALLLANFGQLKPMRVKDIGYCNPNLLLFYGDIDGAEARLIQHTNQLNFVLLTVQISHGSTARRIGYSTKTE